MVTLGFALGLLWLCFGFALALLWVCFGFALGFFGFALGLLWVSLGFVLAAPKQNMCNPCCVYTAFPAGLLVSTARPL